jgi:hypothetical protein
MSSVVVTTLHAQGPKNSELPSLPEVLSPSLEDSSRTVHKEGDPLCTIPMNMAHESSSLGERLRLPKWSAVNSKF